uniref:SGT1 n=1 Tax=Heterorhabditis bacteriophora TaxID=37862 RepID=A0A1I7W678_HETBA
MHITIIFSFSTAHSLLFRAGSLMDGRPRFDWFQTENSVTITILKKGIALTECRVSFENGQLTVYAGMDIIFQSKLSGPVDEKNFVLTCTASKVEVRMPKKSFGQWRQLCDVSTQSSTLITKKNWDAIEKAAVEAEENEKLEGDAAVNQMFRKIYADASDDVKKAMMKSYTESGGTVLSTNWAEISKRKTEVKPPDCMEYKRFEQ